MAAENKAGRHSRTREFAQLLAQITNTTGVHAVVLDENGRLAHQPENTCRHCDTCRRTNAASCQRTQQQLHKYSQGKQQPVVGMCYESGRQAVALPIYAGEKRIATWVLCQLVYDGDAENRMPHPDQALLPHIDKKTLHFMQLLITSLSQPILRLRETNRELLKKSLVISKLAYTDLLLGLPNRNQLQKDIQHTQNGCFLLLDIHDLGKVNEVHGRAIGDELLCALRDHLLSLNIPSSKLYRLTAVHLGLWAHQLGPHEIALHAKKLLAFCTKPVQLRENDPASSLVIHPAVGILPMADLPRIDINSIASAISFVMREAVKTGEVAVFDKQKSEAYRRRIALEMELPLAMSAGMAGFTVVYQPIYNPSSALWKGVEALCRWRSKKYGQVAPDEFIDIAESAGLIGELGLWVLDTALRDTKALGLHNIPHFKLDVNLSPLQLVDPELAEKILAILNHHEYPPGALCLEITESSDITLSGLQLDTLFKLHDNGIDLALDDFGVGYASLSTLHKLPMKVIKTDRSLVQGVDENPFLQRLFYVMGELAHSSGMKIVAEGVENEREAHALLLEGADFFQGYLYAKPLTPKQLAKMKVRFENPMGNLPTGTLHKAALPDRLTQQSNELQRILDRIDALVYVTDPGSGEILFANRCTRDTFGLEDMDEIQCWRALQNQPARCGFCPWQKLRENPQEIQHYELYNEHLGQFLQFGASSIRWHNRDAVLFSAFDIDDLKTRQRWLEEHASIDPLTGVHNRDGFLPAAATMLKQANAEGRVVTLAFLDVDGLKRENDLRGHLAGDALLLAVAGCLRRRTRDSDLVVRYGGDEFIVLFYGCTPKDATRCLEGMLAELAAKDEPESGKIHRFSYGLADSRSLPYRAGTEYIKEMIQTADKRMMAYKKAHRHGGRN